MRVAAFIIAPNCSAVVQNVAPVHKRSQTNVLFSEVLEVLVKKSQPCSPQQRREQRQVSQRIRLKGQMFVSEDNSYWTYTHQVDRNSPLGFVVMCVATAYCRKVE